MNPQAHVSLVRPVESTALREGRAAPRRLLALAAGNAGPLFEPPPSRSQHDRAQKTRSDHAENATVVTFVYHEPSPDVRWVLVDTALAEAQPKVDGDGDETGAAGLRLEPLGDGVWAGAFEIPAEFRGLYGYVAGRPGELLQPPAKSDDRAWWVELRRRTTADPLVPADRVVTTVWGERSELVAPAADPQPWWERGRQRFATARFDEHRLVLNAVERSVWTFAGNPPSGTSDVPRRTLIGFDGETWALRQNLAPSLAALAASGAVPPFVAVFVASIDFDRRAAELTCKPAFRRAVATELLPWIERRFDPSPDARHRIVAGQSYGGLAATDLVLADARFGAAIAQSPSYWWSGEATPMPRPGAPSRWIWSDRLAATTGTPAAGTADGSPGEVADRMVTGQPRRDVRIRCSAGTFETGMLTDAERFRAEAVALGLDVTLRPFCGGHDATHWRAGLVGDLAALL